MPTRFAVLVRYGLPGVLLGLALSWAFSNGRPVSAQVTPPVRTGPGDGSGTIAMTTGTLGSEQRLFLIDTKKQAFAVYKIDLKGWIKLESIRRYQADMELTEYNNHPLSVRDVQESTVGTTNAAIHR